MYPRSPTPYAPWRSLHRGLPLSNTLALQVNLESSMHVNRSPPIHHHVLISIPFFSFYFPSLIVDQQSQFGRKYSQLLTLAGTHLPVWPLTLQTSCFKLVLATQQVPLGTGRPAFWRAKMSRRRTEVSDSMTAALTERAVKKREVRMVNFILAVWMIWINGS